MLYAVICRDKPGHLQTRLDTRERHVAYLKSTPVVLAGPFLENGEMCGSLVVVEQPDLAGAQDWAANDPYAAAGLFESVSVTEWKRVIG
jgi:uncharacterized protein YciI